MKRKQTIGNTIANEEVELDSAPRWLVKKTESGSREIRGKTIRTTTCELIHGIRVRKNGHVNFRGNTYHELRGSTAEKSMTEFALDLNNRNVPPSKLRLCKADGARIPRNGGPNQMMLGELPR